MTQISFPGKDVNLHISILCLKRSLETIVIFPNTFLVYCWITQKEIYMKSTYLLRTYQTSNMQLFAKIINNFQSLTYFEQSFILDV